MDKYFGYLLEQEYILLIRRMQVSRESQLSFYVYVQYIQFLTYTLISAIACSRDSALLSLTSWKKNF